MNLSPAVRAVLTAVAAGVSALGALLAADELAASVPSWVGIVVAVLGAVFTGLGIVPPQVGGTQQGIVNPSLTEPPPADVDEWGH